MDTWATDRRWRRIRVPFLILSDAARGLPVAGRESTAPSDLRVVGIADVESGPEGSLDLVVWSAAFDVLPADAEGHLLEAIPFMRAEEE